MMQMRAGTMPKWPYEQEATEHGQSLAQNRDAISEPDSIIEDGLEN